MIHKHPSFKESNLYIHMVAQFVKTLSYKPGGRGFDSQRHNPSGRDMALESTRPLREMTARNIPWGIKEAGAYS